MAANPQLFNIVTEGELSEALAHYDTEYVLGVVDAAIANRFNANCAIPQPNVVAAWEQNFKQLMAYYTYDEFVQKITEVRNQTYKEIINRIMTKYNLNFTVDEEIDYYSAAYFLYDFFISNFNQYMVTFFANYIFKERSDIYESMNLAEKRKDKDTSTTYGKRLYKDVKLAVINANITDVVSYLLGVDISLENIMLLTMPRDNAIYMASLITANDDFYKNYYGEALNQPIWPILLNEIRFALQNLAKIDGDPLQYSENDLTE